MEVVQLGAFALNAGPVHWSDAAQLVVGVAAAAQTRLETILELFADKIKNDRIYARVDSCKIDADVIQDQEKIE